MALSLVAYDLATGRTLDLTVNMRQLEFTTVAPEGGFGRLSASLPVADLRRISPMLNPFSRCALMDGTFCAFLGRWENNALGLNSTDGDYVTLSAMGLATLLKDDPKDAAYTTQTGQQVLADQLSTRSAYIGLDADATLLLPDNPAGAFARAYSGQTFEQVLNEVTRSLGPGTYSWGVWDHPRNRDAAGFPTGQLQCVIRDTSTVHYQAWAATRDITEITITPQFDHFINVVELNYRDATTLGPAVITVADGRLAGSGAQGTAPFPRRKLRLDWSSNYMSSTQASTAANALVNLLKNGLYGISLTVSVVRDANGAPIPLTQVRADRNIHLPELEALLGTQLPTGYTQGQNLFYIAQTTYHDDSGTLTIDCNFVPNYQAQPTAVNWDLVQNNSNAKVNQLVQAVGAQEKGYCGYITYNILATYSLAAIGVNFKTLMTQTPTSMTLAVDSQLNDNTITTAILDIAGFQLRWSVTADGTSFVFLHYTTNGN